MFRISIISASVRKGRYSHRVALFFKNFIEENNIAFPEIIDLADYNFPVFDERLSYQKTPSGSMLEVSERIKNSDGIIIVTPEYNGGYPASLKNLIDLLYAEWYRKPVAISTVSDGPFGGMQVIISLQYTLWKIKAWTVPALFPVPEVDKNFNHDGEPFNSAKIKKRASVFIKELMWCIEAGKRMA